MKRKMALVVAALAVVAFTALPSMASAAEFTTTPTASLSKGFPGAFTSTGGAANLFATGLPTMNCTAQTDAGNIESAMTGKATITFTGCTESALGTKCKSAGQANGTIVTEALPLHLVYLKPAVATSPHERPGILFTPNATGTFAAFTCAAGTTSIKVTGTGLLCTVTSPGIGGTSSTMTTECNATATAQQHTETVEGQVFGLKASLNGGTPMAAFENAGKDTVTLASGTLTTNTE